MYEKLVLEQHFNKNGNMCSVLLDGPLFWRMRDSRGT